MALAQLLGASLNSEAKAFMTIRDFLAAADGIDDYTPSGPNPGPGYEIIDESYASGDDANPTSGDWCVLRSYGESASHPVYHRLIFGALQHGLSTYLHWDADRHFGVMGANKTDNIYHNGAGDVLLYIHADLDEIHIVIKPRNETNYYWSVYGRIKPDLLTYDGAAVRLDDPVSAGSGATIHLPSWPGWAAPGRKIYHWDTENIHELTITAVDESARTISVETAYAKASGSWLAEDVFVHAFYSRNSSLGNNSGGIGGMPSRKSGETGSTVNCGNFYPPMRSGYMDVKYGDRFAADIWIAYDIQNNQQCRGRLGLARATEQIGASQQAVAWMDEAGRNWRLYRIYNVSGTTQASLALREAD